MAPLACGFLALPQRHLTRRFGAIAQLGERVVRNDEVGGSIPPGSTNRRPRSHYKSAANPPKLRERFRLPVCFRIRRYRDFGHAWILEQPDPQYGQL